MMTYRIFNIIVAVGILTSSCHTQKQTGQSGEGQSQSYLNEAAKLKVKLDPVTNNRGRREVLLTFIVTNNTDRPLRFCKWETPFEPKIGKYFEIIDESGNEASFKGAMARRVMPPPSDALSVVPAHSSVKTTIDLSETYDISGHGAIVTYTGGGVSGLMPGNKLKINF